MSVDQHMQLLQLLQAHHGNLYEQVVAKILE